MEPFTTAGRRKTADPRLTIAVCGCLCFAGCFNAFPLQKDTGAAQETDTLLDTQTLVDTNTTVDTDSAEETVPLDTSTGSGSTSDTSNDTGADSGNDTGSGGEIHCPEGIELKSKILYTGLSTADIDGAEYFDTCPSGQVIIGFEGFIIEPEADSMTHSRFRGLCGVPSIRLVGDACVVEMKPGDLLPVRGTAGDLEWSQTCPDNEVIIGFKAWVGHNIDALIFRCAPLIIKNNAGGHTIELGEYRDMEPVGNTNGGTVDFQRDCPDGTVATTTHLKADHSLRALALGCQEPLLTD